MKNFMSILFHFFSSKKKKKRNTAPHDTLTSISENVRHEIRSHGTPKGRVIFMGTPELAASILTGLLEAKYHIICVITKPDNQTGSTTVVSPVKQKALEHSLPLEQPPILDQQTIEKIKNLKPDLIIVTAYGKI